MLKVPSFTHILARLQHLRSRVIVHAFIHGGGLSVQTETTSACPNSPAVAQGSRQGQMEVNDNTA